ncbi:hypothetical protein Q8A73_023760 [Channa argus]|nr:hypothetical protein Q8A73_023760 [Channa argus]
MQPGDALGGLTQALGQPFGDMEVHRRGSSWAAEPSQEVPRAGLGEGHGGPWRVMEENFRGHPGLRSPGRGASGGLGEGHVGPWRVMEENFRGSSRAAEPRQGGASAGRARAPGALEGHGGRFQGVIPGCGAQAGGASGGSGEGPGGPWRVMEDDFRGSSRAAEPRQGVPRAGRAGAPGAPGGSWRTISGVMRGRPGPPGGASGGLGEGPGGPGGSWRTISGGHAGTPRPRRGVPRAGYQGHEPALAGVPGARVLPLPEYQDHESAFAGVPGPRDKPSFRKQRPPERRSGRTPDALPGSRGAPNGPFHRCQLALFLRFSRLLSFMRRRVKHHLTDRLAHQTRHRRAPAGRPSAGVRAGGSSGPRVGLYVREGPAQGVRESPRLPPRVPPGPTDRKRDRDAPSAPAVLPRSPWRGRGSPAARCQGRPSAARRGPSGKHSVSRTLGSVAPTPQTSLGGRSALPSGVRPPSAQSQARRVRPGSPPLSGGLPG